MKYGSIVSLYIFFPDVIFFFSVIQEILKRHKLLYPLTSFSFMRVQGSTESF